MRICIDATSLLLRSAGVKNYVYHWMRSLQAEAGDAHRVTAFPALGRVGELDHNRSVLSLAQTLPRIALLHFANIRLNPAINAMMSGVDVFHASNLMRNIPRRPKLTATIYDMTVMLLPQFHTPGNVRAETAFYRNVLKRADGLVAISESAKADAVRLLDLDPRRVFVIYPGVDERFSSVSALDAQRVRTAYKLDKPYALFIGTIEPRKNVDALLDAWQRLPPDVREAHDLVIAGPIGWAASATVSRLEASPPGVRVLGYVPERDLPAITAAATIFVYPSFYEGFGFPVAQALAAGVPVVTSNNSSLSEIASGGGILIDPHSSSELTNAVERLLTSSSTRTVLSNSGKRTASQFTWTANARQSLHFFEQLFD